MFVRNLSLRNFRSWEDVSVELDTGTTLFVGRNGFGKTNLLEALYYLAGLRSHRVSTDAPLIRTGAEQAKVSATVENDGRELTVDLLIGGARANKAAINGAPCRRPRDILGILRTVMFAPEDLALVRGDPGERRRFIDELIAMRGPRWAAAKADYDRVLRQRAALLKTASSALRRGDGDSVISTLDVWDAQLADFGAQVTAARIDLVRELEPHVQQSYSTIAPQSRLASMRYRPSISVDITPQQGESADVEYIEAAMLSDLASLRQKEIDRGVCLVGPHRDDVDLLLGTETAKGFASHGESWSFALALRLGSVELVRSDGVEPVLLLDDVFAELDARRREKLADVAGTAEQVLITAAVADDIPASIGGRTVSVNIHEADGVRTSELVS
ncbi:DNA replication and repair protein RecF [Williamsia limnetica]|uniref:DNA replication and repair protein RecF n=1 Tax=Williamsia limnetica TaxID=882452 RepID=A0A318RPE1_WILLI|nr:DNA replication/repair protein RecF [Williamsia limnetica]PYE18682.1 DNA replication and repair protein RecF [Williamsia limnetica]